MMSHLSPSQQKCFERIITLHNQLAARKVIILFSPPGHGKTFLGKELGSLQNGKYIDSSSPKVLKEIACNGGIYYSDWTDVEKWVDKVDRAHDNTLIVFDTFNLLMSIAMHGNTLPFFSNTKSSLKGNTLVFCITEVIGVIDWLKSYWETDKLISLEFTEGDSKYIHHALGKLPKQVRNAHEI